MRGGPLIDFPGLLAVTITGPSPSGSAIETIESSGFSAPRAAAT